MSAALWLFIGWLAGLATAGWAEDALRRRRRRAIDAALDEVRCELEIEGEEILRREAYARRREVGW